MACWVYTNLHPLRIVESRLCFLKCLLSSSLNVLTFDSLQSILGRTACDLQGATLVSKAECDITHLGHVGVAQNPSWARFGAFAVDTDNIHTLAVKRRDVQTQANLNTGHDLRVNLLALDLVQSVIDLLFCCWR